MCTDQSGMKTGVTRTVDRPCLRSSGGRGLAAALLLSGAQYAHAIEAPLDVTVNDPRLAPFVPVLHQCLERRSDFPTDADFFRTEYGAACAAVMLTFRLVTEAGLAESWSQ